MRSLIAILLIAFVACTSSDAAEPAPTSPRSSPSTTSSTPSPTSEPSAPRPASPDDVAPTAFGDSVRIRTPRDGSFLVHGTYPEVESRCRRFEQPTFDARYPGSLEVRRADDGTLRVTVTVDFESYLEGIAEVPPSWPAAALEAQAIAARSYALAHTGWQGEPGGTLDTPICATDACQVYRGIPVEPAPGIGRWHAAVRRTEGLVLAHEGRPIEAVYFSTSNGRIYGNDEVFGSAPLPYLRPQPERDDGASPTARWRVRLPHRDLTRFLQAAGEWPEGAWIARVTRRDGDLVVAGGGQTRTMSLSTFRAAVNRWAPCLMPGRYPSDSRFGTPLPLTVPSGWLSSSQDGDAVVLTGRGWGHGVGMAQWGAYGKARRGWSAERILAHYYGGIEPARGSTPGTIHVVVAEGLTSLRVEPSGRGARIGGDPIGPSGLVIAGGDRLSVEPLD
jgi:stage II sporulation protein D